MNTRPTRVVITGMGVVTAAGCSLSTFWKNVKEGRSSAGPLTRFDPKDSPVRIAAEIQDFDAIGILGSKLTRRLDLSLQYGLAAAMAAVEDAQLRISHTDRERIGVIEGTSLSNNPAAHATEAGFARRGVRGVSPSAMINGYSGGGSGEIACTLELQGPVLTCSSGSASGNDAVGIALALIQAGDADVMIAGGAEAPLLPSVWGGFSLHGIMSRHAGDPAQAMRPFDSARDGFVLGEGAGFLVLETLEHALGRGARIYAEAVGHGRSSEAYDPVAPEPGASGIIRAMNTALHRAEMDPEEIDYINCHGTATKPNDPLESLAISRVFSDGLRPARVAASSTKPITGHLMAASGAVESVVTALSIHHALLPMTPNLAKPAPDCSLTHVVGQSRSYPIRAALNLSSGFGGRNSCLVLRRWERL